MQLNPNWQGHEYISVFQVFISDKTKRKNRMDRFWMIFLIIAHTAVQVQATAVEKKDCKTIKKVYKPCVRNLCCCLPDEAICEGHGKKLGYIPRLPENITNFIFEHNFLLQLSKESFTNISHLKLIGLQITSDEVFSVTEDAFEGFTELKYLTIDNNPNINKIKLSLSFKSLPKATLRKLELRSIGLTTTIPEHFFAGLEASDIRSLILDNNQLTYLNMRVFHYLRHLVHLSLVNNAIKDINLGNGHPTLTVLDLARNEISRKPPSFCLPKGGVFPKLRSLHLQENFISEIVPQAWKCLSKLAKLRLGRNMIRHIPNNSIADLTFLKEFWVDGMSGSQGINMKIDKSAFNCTSLRILRLDSNYIVFKKEHLQNNIFSACKNLAVLSISRNNLWELSEDDVTETLSPLTRLEKLYMVNTHLRSIPKTLLRHFPRLQKFELDGNSVQELGMLLIGPHNLTSLNIQDNNLRVLKPESFPLSVRKKLRSLNLGGNSFDCSCENLWFRNWIGDDGKAKGTNITLVQWPNHYKCFTPKAWNGTLLQTFRPTETYCRLESILKISLGTIGAILFMIIVSIPICTRYRWHIQYMWYKLTKTRKDEERRPLLDNEDKKFPAQPYTYVIYHDSDREFVHHALRNLVEDDLGFKLYIWHRNATHGSKANVMFDAIHESSHVLAIISSTFVTDGWCEFQLDIGLGKKNESRSDCLTLLLLENLDLSLLRKSWCVTLIKNATLYWCSEPESIQSRVCTDQLKSRLSSIL